MLCRGLLTEKRRELQASASRKGYEAMNDQTSQTSPSPEAMRAANAIYHDLGDSTDPRNMPASEALDTIARIIDQETRCADLREALKWAMAELEEALGEWLAVTETYTPLALLPVKRAYDNLQSVLDME